MSFRLLHHAILDFGLDPQAVYEKSGIDPATILDPEARIPHDKFPLYWQALREESQNPDIGLLLGERSDLGAINVTVLLLIASATFGEGITRLLRYRQVLDSSYQWYLTANKETNQASLCFDLNTLMFRERMEGIAVFFTKLFKWATQDKFKPAHISFKHPQPNSLKEYKRIFQCPVSFSQPHNVILFDADILETPSCHASQDLCLLHEQFAQKMLTKLSGTGIVAQVNRELAASLEHGPRDLNTIAERLGLSPQSLQRKLSDTGKTFNDLLDELRKSIATGMLTQDNHPIKEIAYLTGYAELPSFYRAFKRWHGMTPVKYQEKKKTKEGSAI